MKFLHNARCRDGNRAPRRLLRIRIGDGAFSRPAPRLWSQRLPIASTAPALSFSNPASDVQNWSRDLLRLPRVVRTFKFFKRIQDAGTRWTPANQTGPSGALRLLQEPRTCGSTQSDVIDAQQNPTDVIHGRGRRMVSLFPGDMFLVGPRSSPCVFWFMASHIRIERLRLLT